MMHMLWRSRVPGSGAPECLYLEAAQSMENQGYDESDAVSLIPIALEALDAQDTPRLRVLTGHYLSALFNAPRDQACSYLAYARPDGWEDVCGSLPGAHCTRRNLLVRSTNGRSQAGLGNWPAGVWNSD